MMRPCVAQLLAESLLSALDHRRSIKRSAAVVRLLVCWEQDARRPYMLVSYSAERRRAVAPAPSRYQFIHKAGACEELVLVG